jgi:hypothetical protein
LFEVNNKKNNNFKKRRPRKPSLDMPELERMTQMHLGLHGHLFALVL